VEGEVPAVLREAIAARTEEVLARKEPGLATLTLPDGASVTVYSEPLLPQPELIICGAGHIGGALCHLGAWLDFDVAVIDDRSDFANADRLPDADRIVVGDPAEELARLSLGPDSYVVIVTRGHRHDAKCLRACIRSDAAYLGMIGSRRKVKLIFDELREEGLAAPGDLERVHAPIGLNIGGTSVEEIAVSIAAELVAVRSGRGNGEKMSCMST
jgi:xanthine dehydrogenase accessory factor